MKEEKTCKKCINFQGYDNELGYCFVGVRMQIEDEIEQICIEYSNKEMFLEESKT